MLQIAYNVPDRAHRENFVSPAELHAGQVYELVERALGAESQPSRLMRATGERIRHMIHDGSMHALRMYTIIDSKSGESRVLDHLGIQKHKKKLH